MRSSQPVPRFEILALLLACAAAGACSLRSAGFCDEPPCDEPDAATDADGDAPDDGPADSSGWRELWTRTPPASKVDIVVMVDNSGSMGEEQDLLALRFPELIFELIDPGDSDGDTLLDHVPVTDLDIGIISSDMGTAGYAVPTCANPAFGDGGCFRNTPNPGVPGCAATYPAFLRRDETNADDYAPEEMARDFACLATLGTSGCGFEQSLKAMQQAVVDNATAGSCNAGFLRPDSFLLLLWVTDDDDCSVRDDHPEIFDLERDEFGPPNLRCVNHPEFLQPIGEIYDALAAVHPAASMALAMIVGVPPDAAACIGDGAHMEGCLGLAAMQVRFDPADPYLPVPSCNTSLGQAYPPRRFIELARSFGDRAYVDSICNSDWGLTFRGLLETLGSDSADVCLDGELPFDGAVCNSPCALVETLNDARSCEEDPLCPSDRCPAAGADRLDRLEPCRDPSSGAECVPLKRDLGTAMVDGVERRLCLVRQAPRDPSSFRCSDVYNDGWMYSPPDWADCPQVSFLYTGPGTRRLLAWDTAASLICPP